MNVIFALFWALALTSAPLCAQTPASGYSEQGIASWYGGVFQGRPTASGELFDTRLLTAAHPSLPFGTWLNVTNTRNGRQTQVRVNDRGPFVAGRIIDLSQAAAEALDLVATGTAPVVITAIPAPTTVAGTAAQDGKTVRLQVGSYRVLRHAEQAVARLEAAGLRPVYERYQDLHRVVLVGIRADEVGMMTEKLGNAGYADVLIRQER